jgi:ABC-type uncharacterized transport system substrate-binding protein
MNAACSASNTKTVFTRLRHREDWYRQIDPARKAAARALGLQLHVLHASSEREIEAAFETLVKMRTGGLVIMPDQLFLARTEQLAALTVRHAVPSVHLFRKFAAAGGLMSYGTDEAEYYRLVGIYVGRILNGEKPSDLPVQQVTKVELIIRAPRTIPAFGNFCRG